MPTASERITEIDAILAGPERVRHGDRDITYNFAELRRERDRLVSIQSNTGSFRKVVLSNG